MKRKVIQMGGKTAVISLPASWIKKYAISKGDELDLEEIGMDIIIRNNKRIEKNKRSVDLRNFRDNKLIWNLIPAIYIAGVDEIEIFFKGNEQKELIEKCVSLLIGFGITEENEKCIQIKDITGAETEFEPILRRIFITCSALGKEAIRLLESNNLDELMVLKDKDRRINFNVFFCLRYLSKNNLNDSTIVPLIYMLENVGDKFSDTYEYIFDQKIKVSKKFISIFTAATEIVELLYKTYYQNNDEEYLNLVTLLYRKCKEYEVISRKEMVVINKEESIALSYVNAAISTIQDMIILLLSKNNLFK